MLPSTCYEPLHSSGLHSKDCSKAISRSWIESLTLDMHCFKGLLCYTMSPCSHARYSSFVLKVQCCFMIVLPQDINYDFKYLPLMHDLSWVIRHFSHNRSLRVECDTIHCLNACCKAMLCHSTSVLQLDGHHNEQLQQSEVVCLVFDS